MIKTSTPASTSRAARAAQQKRSAAERARRYREKKAATGSPTARDVDAAWSEASSYWIARRGAMTPLLPADVMRTARLILERDGFTPAVAAAALAIRLSSRSLHLQSDTFPSLRPGPVTEIRETRTGPWTTPLDVIERHLARR